MLAEIKEGKLKKCKIKVEDIWNVDITLALLIVPILEEYKKLSPVYPSGLAEGAWDAILDTMIDAFGYIIQANGSYPDLNEYESCRLKLGLHYFSLYLCSLSW